MNAPMPPQMHEAKLRALKAIELFSDMTDETLVRYLSYFEWIQVRADQILIREGDVSDLAFVVVSGVFEVTKGEGAKRKLMAFAKPGTMLGEMGLITNEPRYATCKAINEGEVGLLSIEQFTLMQKKDPDLHTTLVSRMTVQLAGRLRKVTDSILRLKEKNDIAVDAARRIIETSAQV